MFEFLAVAGSLAAAVIGHVQSRRFVARKLRYVEAVQSMKVPIMAGLAAAIVAAPVVWFLPLIGGGTALLFGAGVGTGVAAGAKEIRQSSAGLLEP